MAAPLLIGSGPVAGDDSTGNASPEPITYTVAPTAGNMLLLIYSQGRRSSTALDQPTYAATGWTEVAAAFSRNTFVGTWYHASIVAMVKTAVGDELSTSFNLTHDLTSGGAGRASVWEFEANQGVQVAATHTGEVADPSDAVNIVGSAVERTAVFAWAGANQIATGAVTFGAANSFTALESFTAATDLKRASAYRVGVTGTTALPTINDADADAAAGFFPYAQLALLLGPANRGRRGFGMIG